VCGNYFVVVVENGHVLAKGDNGIIVSAGTQGANMEQKNMSFGELDLNVVPTGTLNEDGIYASYLSIFSLLNILT
jgi:hypothetical protein